jgi:hypothetical protein
MQTVFFCRPSPGTVIVVSNLLSGEDCDLLMDLVPALLSGCWYVRQPEISSHKSVSLPDGSG